MIIFLLLLLVRTTGNPLELLLLLLLFEFELLLESGEAILEIGVTPVVVDDEEVFEFVVLLTGVGRGRGGILFGFLEGFIEEEDEEVGNMDRFFCLFRFFENKLKTLKKNYFNFLSYFSFIVLQKENNH